MHEGHHHEINSKVDVINRMIGEYLIEAMDEHRHIKKLTDKNQRQIEHIDKCVDKIGVSDIYVE